MSKFWSQKVHELTPYVPGEQPKINHLVKLNTNENPYPPSPKVREQLTQTAQGNIHLYPDPNASELKQTIATYYQLNENQVFVGNGSDEVLAHAFVALLKQDEGILFPDISYSFYPVYCELFSIDYKLVPLDNNFCIDSSNYKQKNGGIIFPNPNAPTGIVLSLDAVKQILEMNPNSVVVVDEAYIDFGGQSAISLVNDYSNLLVIQTFSKSRSLAGLRVGFAIGQAKLIEGLERVKNSFNSYPLDFFAQQGAITAINDEAYFVETNKKIIASREYLIEKLVELDFMVLPSAANFVFISHKKKKAKEISKLLRDKNILVRYFDLPRIDNYLRITIGKQQDCELLVKELTNILS